MYKGLVPGLRRGYVLAAVAASISLGVAACNDATSADGSRDRIPPTVALSAIGEVCCVQKREGRGREQTPLLRSPGRVFDQRRRVPFREED